jgi:pyruvate kinase
LKLESTSFASTCHGDQAGHQQVIDLIRRISLERSLSAAILADLQGPKIRLGTFRGGEPGGAGQSAICADHPRSGGAAEIASISYKALQEVKPASILVDDGLIELRVESVSPSGSDHTRFLGDSSRIARV